MTKKQNERDQEVWVNTRWFHRGFAWSLWGIIWLLTHFQARKWTTDFDKQAKKKQKTKKKMNGFSSVHDSYSIQKHTNTFFVSDIMNCVFGVDENIGWTIDRFHHLSSIWATIFFRGFLTQRGVVCCGGGFFFTLMVFLFELFMSGSGSGSGCEQKHHTAEHHQQENEMFASTKPPNHLSKFFVVTGWWWWWWWLLLIGWLLVLLIGWLLVLLIGWLLVLLVGCRCCWLVGVSPGISPIQLWNISLLLAMPIPTDHCPQFLFQLINFHPDPSTRHKLHITFKIIKWTLNHHKFIVMNENLHRFNYSHVLIHFLRPSQVLVPDVDLFQMMLAQKGMKHVRNMVPPLPHPRFNPKCGKLLISMFCNLHIRQNHTQYRDFSMPCAFCSQL